MKNIKFIFVTTIMLLPSMSLSASKFLEFGDVNFGRDYKDKSKWLVKFGTQYIKYEASLPAFKGVHENIKKDEKNDINGAALSFGRDFYLGAGVSTILSVTGYYSKTLDKKIGKAAKDINIDFSQTRTAHQLVSYEASFALNYLFDYRVVDIQPFIEVGAGAGQARVEKQYSRLGLSIETNGSEKYDVLTQEKFAFSRVSLGVNFISFKGVMSYVKISNLQFLKSSRNTTGVTNVFGSTTYNDVSSKEDKISETFSTLMGSIGIGVYF